MLHRSNFAKPRLVKAALQKGQSPGFQAPTSSRDNRASVGLTWPDRRLPEHLAHVPGRVDPREQPRGPRMTFWNGGSGAWGRIRTTDTRIFNPLLYQLSYPGLGPAAR